MVCGPEVMMRYTVDELRRRAVDPSQIFLSMERNHEVRGRVLWTLPVRSGLCLS
jgi:NAD(P)H-flavin reductase